ncbi:endonuclease domain-containing protein [Plantibacter flavus]|uniref:endonuclease domain-containing protein n=1 Tax=Plantibacter flavus TaxID=150123 RepID=UPI003F138B19
MPHELPDGPFLVSEGLLAGMTPGQLRSARLPKPGHGIRTARPADSLEEVCRAFLHRLGAHAFICGPTAALLWGLPLPRRFEDAESLDVAVAAPARAPHARGLSGRSVTVDHPDDLVDFDGMRITSAERTWLDLAARLSLADLVAAGDHLLRTEASTREALIAAAERYPSRRGRRTVAAALPLLDARAESPPESLVRVALHLGRVTGFEPNQEIRGADGAFLARGDLVHRPARVVVEYQGDYHRVESGRWRKDRARSNRLRAAGWTVIELTADDLGSLRSVVAQVRAAITH